MSIDVNELFEMLNWNNDEEIQKKGIEEGKKIKYLSILMQPIEDKGIWENCAKIISQKSDKTLQPYINLLLEWLQDANWPGYNIIYDRIKSMPIELIISDFKNSLKKAVRQENITWIWWLGELSKDTGIYNKLTEKERSIIDKAYEE